MRNLGHVGVAHTRTIQSPQPRVSQQLYNKFLFLCYLDFLNCDFQFNDTSALLVTNHGYNYFTYAFIGETNLVINK